LRKQKEERSYDFFVNPDGDFENSNKNSFFIAVHFLDRFSYDFNYNDAFPSPDYYKFGVNGNGVFICNGDALNTTHFPTFTRTQVGNKYEVNFSGAGYAIGTQPFWLNAGDTITVSGTISAGGIVVKIDYRFLKINQAYNYGTGEDVSGSGGGSSFTRSYSISSGDEGFYYISFDFGTASILSSGSLTDFFVKPSNTYTWGSDANNLLISTSRIIDNFACRMPEEEGYVKGTYGSANTPKIFEKEFDKTQVLEYPLNESVKNIDFLEKIKTNLLGWAAIQKIERSYNIDTTNSVDEITLKNK